MTGEDGEVGGILGNTGVGGIRKKDLLVILAI
jgi:hypothetical protein